MNSVQMRRFRTTTNALEAAARPASVPPCVEHMAEALNIGNVCLLSRDAPVIYLTTMLADKEIDMRVVDLAVSRAFELRRDRASGRVP